MSNYQLFRKLDRVASRIRRFRLWRRLSICWLLATCCAIGLVLVQRQTDQIMLIAVEALMACTLAVGLAVYLLSRKHGDDRLKAARSVESSFPELDERLLAAIEQQPNYETGKFSFLQQQLINEVLRHGEQNDWSHAIPTKRLMSVSCYQLLCFGLFAFAATMLFQFSPARDQRRSFATQTIPTALPGMDYGIAVDPGDTSLERGTSLYVFARFSKTLPSKATLVVEGSQTSVRRIALTKSLDDPVFIGKLADISGDLRYRVEYDERRTDDYQITVFDFPHLDQTDATVTFPEYTNLPQTVIEDTQRVTVVEGSSITLTCTMNKTILTARLVPKSGPAVILRSTDEQQSVFESTLHPTTSQVFHVLHWGQKTFTLPSTAGRGILTGPWTVWESRRRRRAGPECLRTTRCFLVSIPSRGSQWGWGPR